MTLHRDITSALFDPSFLLLGLLFPVVVIITGYVV